MSGKGDDPRPLSVPQDEFNRRWDAIDWNARERQERVRVLDTIPPEAGVRFVPEGPTPCR